MATGDRPADPDSVARSSIKKLTNLVSFSTPNMESKMKKKTSTTNMTWCYSSGQQ